MVVTGFDRATINGDVAGFLKCVRSGHNLGKVDFFRRTPIFGLRFCDRASVDEFVEVLHAFIDGGANIDHIDAFGNSLLVMAELDNLGVALVRVGARIRYTYGYLTKRALANAAMYACTQTMDAIILLCLDEGEVGCEERKNELDSCLDQAARMLAFNSYLCNMSGIVMLVRKYGADVDRWNTLHSCVRSNHTLVSTLLELGANPSNLAWDVYRRVNNTPLHRVSDMTCVRVFDALIGEVHTLDIDAVDSVGATPLMSLMKTPDAVHSDNHIYTRLSWLVERGCSFLPFDSEGKRVSASTTRAGSALPFDQVISAGIRRENWRKRRGMIFMRVVAMSATKPRLPPKKRRPCTLIATVAECGIEGVFRHIVTFL